MDNIVNQRFKRVYHILEERGIIKGKSDLAEKLKTYNHVVNSILKGKRNITVDQLHRLMEIYDVDANFLFGLGEAPFRKASATQADLAVRPSSAMQFGPQSSITWLRDKVRVGDAIPHQNLDFQQDQPRFSLPNISGEGLVAFPIEGDSMMPTITQGDLLVCEPVERDAPILDNHIYVVVTDVLVAKRIQQLRRGNELEGLRLISDNPVYQPYHVPTQEVRQLLKAKCRVTTHGVG